MIADPVTRWIFTALFVAIAGYLAYRAVAERKRPVQAIGDWLHVAMALVMAAMAWRFWRMLPWTAQLVFFSAATVWFVAVAVAMRLGRLERRRLHHPAWHQVVHSVMMASMAWMVAVMPPGSHHRMMTMPELVSGYVLTIAMLVAAVAFAVDAVRKRQRGHRHGTVLDHGTVLHHGTVLDTMVMIAMLLGMSWMNWLMF